MTRHPGSRFRHARAVQRKSSDDFWPIRPRHPMTWLQCPRDSVCSPARTGEEVRPDVRSRQGVPRPAAHDRDGASGPGASASRPRTNSCEELGVSRGSLREAVRMLAALGVIEPRHGSGTYVSQLRPEDVIGSLSLTLELLPLSGLLEVYEIRRVLEAHVAAKAAARRTPETAKHALLAHRGDGGHRRPHRVSELDHRFHAEIARVGGNPTLASLLAVFRARSRNYQVFTLPEGPEMRTQERRGPPGHRHRDRRPRPGRRCRRGRRPTSPRRSGGCGPSCHRSRRPTAARRTPRADATRSRSAVGHGHS